MQANSDGKQNRSLDLLLYNIQWPDTSAEGCSSHQTQFNNFQQLIPEASLSQNEPYLQDSPPMGHNLISLL